MKKFFAAVFILALIISFSSCSGRDTEKSDGGQLAGVININTQEAWEEKFPNRKIGSFNIHYAEYETGEYEEIYFFADGETLKEWESEPFNLSGWFVHEDMLVSGDGQYGIELSETLQDGCTLEAVKLKEAVSVQE